MSFMNLSLPRSPGTSLVDQCFYHQLHLTEEGTGSEKRSGLPKASPLSHWGTEDSPPGIKTPRASVGKVRAQVMEKHEGLFLMKPDLLLRPSPTSESHSRVLAQLYLKQDSFGAQPMPQIMYLIWVPLGFPIASWPGWGDLRPLHSSLHLCAKAWAARVPVPRTQPKHQPHGERCQCPAPPKDFYLWAQLVTREGCPKAVTLSWVLEGGGVSSQVGDTWGDKVQGVEGHKHTHPHIPAPGKWTPVPLRWAQQHALCPHPARHPASLLSASSRQAKFLTSPLKHPKNPQAPERSMGRSSWGRTGEKERWSLGRTGPL